MPGIRQESPLPTVVGHALVGAGLLNYARPLVPKPWQRAAPLVAGVLATSPDLDVAGFRFGVDYGDHFGHRGFTHSLAFAAALGLLGTARLKLQTAKEPAPPGAARVVLVAALLILAAASHPLLDMLTDGGLGCALFAPFSWSRLFFAARPIPVSPIGLSSRLVPVLTWELAFFLPFFLGSRLACNERGPYVRALGLGLGQVFSRKLEVLLKEFRDLIELDQDLGLRETINITFFAAHRPSSLPFLKGKRRLSD